VKKTAFSARREDLISAMNMLENALVSRRQRELIAAAASINGISIQGVAY
jgi:hypothetical protein